MKIWAYVLSAFLLVFPGLPNQRQKEQPPDTSHLSVLGLTIGKDTLASLQDKLGPVKKCHTNEHVSVAGYTNGKEDLIFEFSEVGGGNVTAFYLRPSQQVPTCPLSRLPSQTSEVATKGGIHLGMAEVEFLHIFGPPESRNKQGKWSYYWTREVKLTEEEKREAVEATPGYTVSDTADVAISIEACFSNATLRYFYISKVEVS
jgi:hypothetical protein